MSSGLVLPQLTLTHIVSPSLLTPISPFSCHPSPAIVGLAHPAPCDDSRSSTLRSRPPLFALLRSPASSCVPIWLNPAKCWRFVHCCHRICEVICIVHPDWHRSARHAVARPYPQQTTASIRLAHSTCLKLFGPDPREPARHWCR